MIAKLKRFNLVATYKAELIVFFASFSWLVFHWLAHFPAMYSWDFFRYMHHIFELDLKPGSLAWESYLYEVYLYLLVKLSATFVYGTLIQILLFALFVTEFFNVLFRHLKFGWSAYFYITLLLIVPPSFYLPLMTERDTMAVIFGLFGLVYLAKFLFSTVEKNSFSAFCTVFFFFGLMTAFRKEAGVSLILLPIVFYFHQTENRIKNFFKHAVLVLIVTSSYISITNRLGLDNPVSIESHYNMNSFLYSLSYILLNENVKLSQEDREYTKTFFDIKKMKSVEEFRHILKKVLDHPQIRLYPKIFNSLILRTFINNSTLFLESRWDIFHKSLSANMVSQRLTPAPIKYPSTVQFASLFMVYKYETKVLRPELEFLVQFYQFATDKKSFMFRLSHPSSALVVIFLFLLLVAWTPLSKYLLVFPLTHSFIVFFMQPAVSSKYYYFDYLSVFIILPFVVWELKVRIFQQRSKKKRNGVNST